MLQSHFFFFNKDFGVKIVSKKKKYEKINSTFVISEWLAVDYVITGCRIAVQSTLQYHKHDVRYWRRTCRLVFE